VWCSESYSQTKQCSITSTGRHITTQKHIKSVAGAKQTLAVCIQHSTRPLSVVTTVLPANWAKRKITVVIMYTCEIYKQDTRTHVHELGGMGEGKRLVGTMYTQRTHTQDYGIYTQRIDYNTLHSTLLASSIKSSNREAGC